MARYLFDTSALLAHFRHETGWEEVQRIFEDPESAVFLAGISLAEFARRLNDLGAPDEEIDQTVSDYELLFAMIAPVDARTAKAAYKISQTSTSRLPLIDALIAAVAQELNAILVHRDQHMAAIPEAVLEQLYLQVQDRS